MGRVLRLYFSDLLQGDPVALSVTGGIAAVGIVICLIWWKIARDLRREDEEQKKRYGGGKKG